MLLSSHHCDSAIQIAANTVSLALRLVVLILYHCNSVVFVVRGPQYRNNGDQHLPQLPLATGSRFEVRGSPNRSPRGYHILCKPTVLYIATRPASTSSACPSIALQPSPPPPVWKYTVSLSSPPPRNLAMSPNYEVSIPHPRYLQAALSNSALSLHRLTNTIPHVKLLSTQLFRPAVFDPSVIAVITNLRVFCSLRHDCS